MSPPQRRPLMGLLALRSFVCARPPGRLVPWPRLGFSVSGEPSGSSPRAIPRSCEAGSSSRELLLPCRVLPIRVRLAPAVERGRLPWGLAPLRGINLRRPPDTRFPRLASVPSSAFHTPSTVCSATGLAGLFHPAAASRVRSSGVCPPGEAVPSRRRPVPSSLAPARCRTVARPTPRTYAPPSGLALHRDPSLRRRGLAVCTARSPLELFLLQVLLLLAVGAPSRPRRSWPSPQVRRVVPAADLQRLTDEKLGFPLSRLPTCSRFPACRVHPLKGLPDEAGCLCHP
jgi:hypothetical protein